MPRRTLENAMQTKKKILETAQRLFSRRGFERTSLSDIAKGAGCTRGAIYWHFENKEELLMSLLENLEQEQFGIEYLNEACDPNSYNPSIYNVRSYVLHASRCKGMAQEILRNFLVLHYSLKHAV